MKQGRGGLPAPLDSPLRLSEDIPHSAVGYAVERPVPSRFVPAATAANTVAPSPHRCIILGRARGATMERYTMEASKDRDLARAGYVETVAAELMTATFEADAAALGVECACDVIIEVGLDDAGPVSWSGTRGDTSPGKTKRRSLRTQPRALIQAGKS
jgi:hypothetical protein